MKLQDLLKNIQPVEIAGDVETEVTGVNIDSRKIKDSHLFVAMKGTQVDGHKFIPKAIELGAKSILCEDMPEEKVVGVTQGFEKKLQLVGVGYKAEKKGDTLVMSLGYSHPVELKDPEGITTECPSATEVTVKGIDKAVVGNYAANIRAWRRPEPYKGKGIKYADEVIRRKEGKAGAK